MHCALCRRADEASEIAGAAKDDLHNKTLRRDESEPEDDVNVGMHSNNDGGVVRRHSSFMDEVHAVTAVKSGVRGRGGGRGRARGGIEGGRGGGVARLCGVGGRGCERDGGMGVFTSNERGLEDEVGGSEGRCGKRGCAQGGAG